MFIVGADFEKVDFIAILYFKTNFLKRSGNTVGQYFPSILDGTDDVVEQARLVVAFLDMPIGNEETYPRFRCPRSKLRGNLFDYTAFSLRTMVRALGRLPTPELAWSRGQT